MNEKAMQTYWYWINERHNIYLRRNDGQGWPWTLDPILRDNKFTNVFRELDRTTIPLIMRLNLHDEESALQFFNICLYRVFNWTPTYVETGDWCKRWDEKRKNKIRAYKASGKKTFTGAYVIPNIGSPLPKIELVFKTLDMLWKDKRMLVNRIAKAESVEQAVHTLRLYPIMGGFMSYEVACDLLYTPILNKAADRFTWANPGPGAKNGLKAIYATEYVNKDSACVNMMRAMYNMYPKKIGEHVKKEPYTIDMRLIENGLCEFSKYWRIKELGGRAKNRYRRPK